MTNFTASPSPAQDPEVAEPEVSSRPMKITGYRLLTSLAIIAFGTAKIVESMRGQELVAAWIEWGVGTVAAILLYWLGHYEGVQPPVANWFFHRDYSRILKIGLAVVAILSPLGVVATVFSAGDNTFSVDGTTLLLILLIIGALSAGFSAAHERRGGRGRQC